MKLKTVTALMLVSTIAFAQTETAAPAATAPAATTEAKPAAPAKKAKKAKKKAEKTTSEAKQEVAAPVAAAPVAPEATVAAAAPAANQTTATTSLKSEQDKSDLNKTDEAITNAKMRAELGANKKYSFSANLSYSGSTVERPFNEIRPNIRAGLGRDAAASLGGTLSGRYKLDANNTLSLGTGISVVTPFHGNYDSNNMDNPANGKKVERVSVSDPSISYTYATKAGSLMSVSSVEVSAITNSQSRQLYGQIAGLDLSQQVAGDFAGWTLGVVGGINIPIYENLTADQKQYESKGSMFLSPFAEYAFNDTYNFRTVLNYFGWDLPANAAQGTIESSSPQQSMGLGISITRDIYMYPNVQFIPFNLRADLTNVGLSTTINL